MCFIGENLTTVLGVPSTSLRFSALLRGLTGLSCMSHRIILVTIIYYTKRIQTKSGKDTRGKFWRKSGTNSKSPLPVESHRMYLIPPAMGCDNMCLPGKFIRNSVCKVFIGESSA